MEYFGFSLLIVFVLMLSISLLKFFFYKPKSAGGRIPPGNSGWPVIGESIPFSICPRKFIRDRMAKYSPNVFKTCLLGEQFAVFCGPAGNKFLFSNENKLVQVWLPSAIDKIFPHSKQTSNSKEESLKFRKMLPNFLKPNMLERFIGTMDQITQEHFSSTWEKKDQVVVYPLTKRLTFANACRVFLSLEDPNVVDDLAHRFNHIAPGLYSLPINFPGTPIWRAVKSANYIRKKLLGIIKQRRIALGEGKTLNNYDILSHMLMITNENGEVMNDLDISDKILGLLVGGHDTTNSLCTSIVKYLAEIPQVYEGVYKEQTDISKAKSPNELLNWNDLQKMKYSWNVICEVLRLAPPLSGTFRESISDFVFSGFLIPKGWKLHWNMYTTHMNPDFFTEPEKFDPSRFEGNGLAPFTYVPFGGGPRMCPGKEYARLELLIFMHYLVKRFKWKLVDPHEKIILNPMPRPEKGLPVYLYPHVE